MPLAVAQAAGVVLVSILLWRLLRPYVIKNPLSDIAGPPPASYYSGNVEELFSFTGWDAHDAIAKTYGAAARVYGYLGELELYTFDPLALHHIFIKYQNIYEETDIFFIMNKLIFGTSLLSTDGNHHKRQRKMLNPVFSLKHMRGLTPVFYPIAHRLRDVLSNKIRDGEKDINIMAWMSRAALEYIGQGGLGYSFDALDERKENKYNQTIKMLGPLLSTLIELRTYLPYAVKCGPAWFRRKLLGLSPIRKLKHMRDIVDVMDATSEEVFEKKKGAFARGDESVLKQVGQGKDILSILMKANMESNEEERMPDSEFLGHMNTFIFAGHDTSTSALSRILHQLTLRPDVQEKLRAEVSEARAREGDLEYDTLMNLPYLDAVVRETLRYFPPVPTLERVAREDCVLPLAWPIKSADGKRELDSIRLKKNTIIKVSILNANRCTRIWGPDANEWKPERWLDPLPASVAKAHMPGVYASMMTFIGGGRACIGFKFAELEIKLVLSVLLDAFVFSPGSKEIYWNMTGIATPVVKDVDNFTPQLPLNVTFAKA